MVFLIHIPLFSQEHVTIGKYKNFQSAKLGGEVSYLVHLTGMMLDSERLAQLKSG